MVDFDLNVLIGENGDVGRNYAEKDKGILTYLQAVLSKGFDAEKVLHRLSFSLLFVNAL